MCCDTKSEFADEAANAALAVVLLGLRPHAVDALCPISLSSEVQLAFLLICVHPLPSRSPADISLVVADITQKLSLSASLEIYVHLEGHSCEFGFAASQSP